MLSLWISIEPSEYWKITEEGNAFVYALAVITLNVLSFLKKIFLTSKTFCTGV